MILIYGALRNLVLFVQFKKREKHRCYSYTYRIKPLVAAECWYEINVCIMYDMSQVHYVLNTTVLKLYSDRSTNYFYMPFFIFYRFRIVLHENKLQKRFFQ